MHSGNDQSELDESIHSEMLDISQLLWQKQQKLMKKENELKKKEAEIQLLEESLHQELDKVNQSMVLLNVRTNLSTDPRRFLQLCQRVYIDYFHDSDQFLTFLNSKYSD